MNELTIFNNERFGSVRTLVEGDTVLFCAADVARALGYTNTSKAISDHCKGVTKRYIPTKKGMNLGLFDVKEGTVINPDGSVRITRTTKITGKGQEFFINLFLKGGCTA